MSDALRVQGEALRLTHIVKQHRPAEHRVRRRGVQSMKRVLPYVITVVRIPLVKSHHRQNFRQHRADHVRVPPQDGRCPRAAEQLRQFLVNTLRGHLPQQVPTGHQCLAGFRFDGKAQHRRKPQAAQDPQGVLRKLPLRIAHAAQNSLLQVRLSAEGVIHRPSKVCCHGVDGKIPAGQIFCQIRGKRDLFRVAVVGVNAVPAEGGGLHFALLTADGHRTVLQSRGNSLVAENLHGLLRQRGGGDVPILRHPAQQAVPDAAAHAVRLMARRLQCRQRFPHIGRNF